MAYKSENEEREILGTFDKNARGDKVRVSVIKNDDTISYDIRNMYTDDNDELRYTSKGIRMKEEITIDVVASILNNLNKEGFNQVLAKVDIANKAEILDVDNMQ